MGPLHRFWIALEDLHGHSATMFEWRKRLGTDLELAAAFLHPIGRFAASAPVSDDPFTPPYRLTHLGNGTVEASSPLGDDTITMAEVESLIHRVAFRPLSIAVAEAFGFDAAYEEVAGIPSCHRIGSLRPYAGCSFAVFFVSATAPEDLTKALETLAFRWTDPFLVVLPTLRQVRSSSESLIKVRKASLLALTELVTVGDSSQLVCRSEGSLALSSFIDRVLPQKPGEPQPAAFPTPPNASWHDVRMKEIDWETVSVRIGEVTRRLTYIDMGMCHERSKKPTKQWNLLLEFAREHGWLTWDSPGADRKNSSRRRALARGLQTFFRIDGDPIRFEKKPKKGWRTRFSIEPA
jgi:hypothetical protein